MHCGTASIEEWVLLGTGMEVRDEAESEVCVGLRFALGKERRASRHGASLQHCYSIKAFKKH